VILEGPDGSFGSITSMDMRGNELKFAVVRSNGLLEGHAGLIVHDMVSRPRPNRGETGEDVVVGRDAVTVVLGGEGPNKDGIRRSVEGNHDVLVAAERAWVETAGVICKQERQWKFMEFDRGLQLKGGRCGRGTGVVARDG